MNQSEITPIENYLWLLKYANQAQSCIGQEIPGEGKKWIEDVINSIKSNRLLSEKEKTFLLDNTIEAEKHLYAHNFRYAATYISRVCSTLLAKALFHSQEDTNTALGNRFESIQCCWHCRHYIRQIEFSIVDGPVGNVCTVKRDTNVSGVRNGSYPGDKIRRPDDYCDKFQLEIPPHSD